mmetsp:Transcript_47910/g.94085  ORF Transcript_47910/g.94085 Transcript_47910/m.94085 type:complete len:382 (+) Transcript_47910:69-1214(+)
MEVECPICGSNFSASSVEQHVELCLEASEKAEQLKENNKTAGILQQHQQQQQKQQPSAAPGLQYNERERVIQQQQQARLQQLQQSQLTRSSSESQDNYPTYKSLAQMESEVLPPTDPSHFYRQFVNGMLPERFETPDLAPPSSSSSRFLVETSDALPVQVITFPVMDPASNEGLGGQHPPSGHSNILHHHGSHVNQPLSSTYPSTVPSSLSSQSSLPFSSSSLPSSSAATPSSSPSSSLPSSLSASFLYQVPQSQAPPPRREASAFLDCLEEAESLVRCANDPVPTAFVLGMLAELKKTHQVDMSNLRRQMTSPCLQQPDVLSRSSPAGHFAALSLQSNPTRAQPVGQKEYPQGPIQSLGGGELRAERRAGGSSLHQQQNQ